LELKISVISALLQVLPENFGLLLAGFAMTQLPIDWRRIAVVSIIHSLTVYFVREMPLVFGVHTIIFIFALTLYILIIFRLTFLHALYVAQMGMMLLVALEATYTMILIEGFHLNLSAVLANPFIRSLSAIPFEAGLFLIAFFQNKKNIEKWKKQQEEEEKGERLMAIMDREIEEMKKGILVKKKY